jgi:hypothetical protein
VSTLKLAGPKVLLLGAAGTGKSYSIGTLVDWAEKNGFHCHVIYTENSLETLLGYWLDRGKEVPKSLAWHVNIVPALPLDSLIKGAKDSGMMSYKQLTEMTDPDRMKNNPWEKFLRLLTDVPDDRTGAKFGSIDTWDNRKILVIDSLTEAANAAFRMQTGNKPTASPPEYQVAQNNFYNWLRYMAQSLRCTFVMTGHPQRQMNELTGAQNVTTSAIGKALGEDIPRQFSEVVWCRREGVSWVWDNMTSGIDTKKRYLPLSAKILPDFAQIMDPWMKRAVV